MAMNTITPSAGRTRNALAMATPSKKVCNSSPTSDEVLDQRELARRAPGDRERPDDVAERGDQGVAEGVRHETGDSRACCGLDPRALPRAVAPGSPPHRARAARRRPGDHRLSPPEP